VMNRRSEEIAAQDGGAAAAAEVEQENQDQNTIQVSKAGEVKQELDHGTSAESAKPN